MGIINREGALYMATGIDNSGIYQGREEAMGIIRAMAKEITTFDVFGGIGISAGLAFAKAAKDSYSFEKQFQQSMKEVATLSSGIQGSLTDYMNSVIDITRNIPIQANDAAKALYQIVSAGHDGADGMKVLEVSAKAAIGGVTDTATAADAITTVLNAYKMKAEDAEKVSDMLFKTVKLGKTDFGELGRSIAQAAPIAASFGINIEDVLAAVASLTKQGTPTAEAMTRIRAAIIGTADYLGDAAFQGRSLQEALKLVYDQAGGSSTELKRLLGTTEAMQAALMITGQNAKSAAADLGEIQRSAGAADDAFEEMASSAQNQMQLLSNNITAYFRPLGEGILREVSTVATALNEAFKNGDVSKTMKELGDLIVIVTGAFVGYKGALALTSIQQKIFNSLAEMTRYEMALYNKAVEAGTIAENALTASQVKSTAVRRALTTTIKMQTAAMLKNVAAVATNPYVLAAAAVAALGFSIYKLSTYQTDAEKAQSRLNKAFSEVDKNAVSEQRELATLKGELSGLTKGTDEYNSVKNKIVEKYGKYYKGLEDEIDKVGLTETAYKKLTKAINESFSVRQYQKFKQEQTDELDSTISDNLEKIQDRLIEKLGDEAGSKYYAKIRDAILKGSLKVDNGYNISGLDKETQSALDKTAGTGNFIVNRAVEGYIKNIVRANELTDELDKKAQKRFGISQTGQTTDENSETKATKGKNSTTYQQDLAQAKADWQKAKKGYEALLKDQKATSAQVKKAKDEMAKAETKYKDLGGATGSELTQQETKAEQIKKQTEKYKTLLNAQAIEEKRMAEDLQNQIEEGRIKAMDSGSKKTIAEMEQNFEEELQTIDRQKEDAMQKKIEDARSAFDAKPNKKKGETFDASNISLSDDEIKKFDELYKAAIVNWEKEQSNYNKKSKDAWNEYYREFGTYLQKRQAIIDSYNEQIKKAGTDGDKAKLQKNMQNELDDLDNSVQNSATLMGQLFADASKKSVSEIQKIIDKAELLMQYLESTKDGQGSANIGGKTVTQKDVLGLGISKNTLDNLKKSPEAVESFRNAIDKLKGELESKSPFKLFENQVDDAIDKIKKGGKKNISQGISDMGSAITAFMPALEQTGQDLGTIFGSEGLGKDIASTTQLIGGLGQTAIGVGQIMSGDIVGGAMSAISGIAQVGTAVSDLFNKSKNKAQEDTEQLQNVTKKIEQTNQAINDLIEKRIDLIKEATGAEAGYLNQLTQEQITQQQSYLQGMFGRLSDNDIFGKKGKHNNLSLSELMDKYGLSDLSDFAEWWSNGGARELIASGYDLRNESDWQSIVDSWNDLTKAAENSKEATQEAATSISFDDFKSSYEDMLDDLDADNEDFSNNFGKQLQKSIIKSLLSSKYKAQIQDLYNTWADYGSDGKYTEDEVEKLKEMEAALTDAMLAERDKLKQTFGWTSDDDESGTTGKLEASLTEGTANELVGLWNMTALDIRSIKELLPDHFNAFDNMKLDVEAIMNNAEAIKNNTLRSANNSDSMLEKLDKMSEELTSIKKNTKGYTGRG